MDKAYRELAQRLQYVASKFRGYVDLPEDERAQRFASGIKLVIGAASSNKGPRSIEEQIKKLVQLLEEAAEHSDEMMDYRHVKDLRRDLEEIRDDLRKFSNY